MSMESDYLLGLLESIKVIDKIDGESDDYLEACEHFREDLTKYVEESNLRESWVDLICRNMEDGRYGLAREGLNKINGAEV